MQQFTDQAKTALQIAARTAKRLQQNYIGSEHILTGLLKEKTGVAASVLNKNGVEEGKLLELITDLIAPSSGMVVKEKGIYSPKALAILEESHKQAHHFRAEKTGTEHILLAIMKEGDNAAVRLLNTLGVQLQRLSLDIFEAMGESSKAYREEMSAKGKKNADPTATLNQYSRDLTKLAKEGKLDPIIGREAEIKRVIQILSRRTKNNPCLIGEPGVGKTAIAEGLALRIVAGDVPPTVQNKRVVTLDLSGMVAGSKYRGEFEERVKKIIREVTAAGNVLLFLDEIHTLIGAGGAEGAIDASNILKPSLARGEIQLIGATTIAEYRKHIEKDAALERRFQPVNVEEPSVEETVKILKGVRERYENHHGVKITDEAIIAAATLSERYINDRKLPDKALDLMDEAAAATALKNMQSPAKALELRSEIKKMEAKIEELVCDGEFEAATLLKKDYEKLVKKAEKPVDKKTKALVVAEVSEEDIAKIVSDWTKIPLNKINEKESERLLKLESILHQRVIGQENAVSAVARAIRRGRVGLQDPKRPIGSFLFLGPTGVGKTELTKALAEAMFGDENALIRVDMSEYMESYSVSKMIGSPPGYVGFEDGGQLSERVRRNPYSVILFDEIEKAHPDVFNILLQILDDGHITDSKGRKVSFKNTILIMTSNAGAQRIVDPKNLGFSSGQTKEQSYEKMKSGVMEEVKRIFKPEFINRIDEIMVFSSLTKEDMKEIITLLAKNLVERCAKQMDITLSITPALKEYIVDKHSDLKMGARPLKRAVQTVIEDALTEEILSGRIKAGDKVVAGCKQGKINFTKK